MTAAELITDDRGGGSMLSDGVAVRSVAELTATCSGCRRTFPRRLLARSGRCLVCKGIHTTRNTVSAVVSPFTPFEEDPAAQAFVEAIPDGATLEQVADASGLTRERIRQIEERALAKAREAAAAEGLSAEDLVRALSAKPRANEHLSDAGGGAQPTEKRAHLHPTLQEELYSPSGERLARGVLELELSAALLQEITRRATAHEAGLDPGPIPTALERLVLELEGMPIAGAQGAGFGPEANAAPGDRAEAPAVSSASSGRTSRDSRERPALTSPAVKAGVGIAGRGLAPAVSNRPAPDGHRAGSSPVGGRRHHSEEKTPMPAPKSFTWNGETKTYADWARTLDIGASLVAYRIKTGKNPDGSVREASSPPPSRTKRAASTSAVDDVRDIAQAQDPITLLERLGVVHELVGVSPKGRIVLFPFATPDA